MARKLNDYPLLGLKPEDLKEKMYFADIFGRSAPVHIEIGSGKGTFLVNQATSQPGINFLGIEWANKYYRYSVDRIGRWRLKNVRIIRTDAKDLITNYVPDESVDCFHIYFPDPWPKKRHHKRRLFQPVMFDQLLRCLKSNGVMQIATDHCEYFNNIKEISESNSEKVEGIEFLATAGAEPGEWAGTNFERKYLNENRPIYTLALKKRLKPVGTK
ncbi:MAG: tRNA (guanosine(46)-N7)-methyltransferase TrmB [Planctomycetota bacterium]|jgi:tRNA (guanine-N7-)-methyltransferase